MLYFYFNPLNPQYYFPDNFKKYPVFMNFYKPYNTQGVIMWWLWSFSLIRRFYSLDNLEPFLPERVIRTYCGEDQTLAYNIGHHGPEQKITIIGVDQIQKSEYFIKFAQTAISKINVRNEGSILFSLRHLNFVPKVMDQKSCDGYELLKTSILKGKRFNTLMITDQLLDILYKLSVQTVKSIRDYDGNYKSCFAHGDFCPWNLMVGGGEIQVFDWEMAGNYPVGYDLFTFIFQTSFLLHPHRKIEKIIKKHRDKIDAFFNKMKISDWKPYLLAFSRHKYLIEKDKRDSDIYMYYLKLISFAENMRSVTM